jgi:hypothetical protein
MCHIHWHKMSFLGYLIHNHHDGNMLLHYFGQLGDEIHCHHFPFPLKSGKWLQQFNWMYVLFFYFLTLHALGYIINHITLHAWPKILASSNYNSLLISWVPNIRHIVHFSYKIIVISCALGTYTFPLYKRNPSYFNAYSLNLC